MKKIAAVLCCLAAQGAFANPNKAEYIVGAEYGMGTSVVGDVSQTQLVLEYRGKGVFGISAEIGNATTDIDLTGASVSASINQYMGNFYHSINDSLDFKIGAGIWTSSGEDSAADPSFTAQIGLEYSISKELVVYGEGEMLGYGASEMDADKYAVIGVAYKF